VFVDGLKRAIQTKKDATIHQGENGTAKDVMTVSGLVVYDFVGRSLEQYYPVTESLGQPGTFNASKDAIPPTRLTYDVLDRNLCTTIPDNTQTCTSYGFGNDRNGKLQFLTRVVDANGIAKESYRDLREVITSVKEFNDKGSQILWTSYDYDALKQILKVWDDKNNLTEAKYDNLGRRLSLNNPDTGLVEWTYDLAGNVTQKVTANLRAQGGAMVYDYDYKRLNRITYPQHPENNVTYSYGAPGASDNRANRVVTVTDESGKEERFYGRLGEVVKTIKTVASDTQGKSANSPEIYTTLFEYDTWNRLQKLTYPDGEVLTNLYDSGGLLRTISGTKSGQNYAYLNRLEYDKFDQRALVEYGNKTRTRYSYNEYNRRLAGLQAGTGAGQGKLFQDLTYDYDNVGNILGQANHAATKSPSEMGGATQFKYQYDDLYRLVHAEGIFDTQPDKRHTYRLEMQYNSIHNILLKDQLHELKQPSTTTLVQKPTTYKFDYQYAGPQPHAPTHIGVKTYTYDANGNQTGWTNDPDGTLRIIDWDEENRIQRIVDNGNEKTYKYNDAGERVIKVSAQGETVYVNQFFVIRNGSVATKHVFAGSSRLVSKLAKQENPTIAAQNKGTTAVTDGPNEHQMYFYHPDHLGSSSYVTDQRGKVFQHLEYFPFGETWVEESSNTQRTPYLFTAKELDEDTGLYYFGARYYDARTSVWASVDPILGSYLSGKAGMGGVYNPFNLGLYSYGHLNPVKFVDPDGNIVEHSGKINSEAVSAVRANHPLFYLSDLVTGGTNDPILGLFDIEVAHEHLFFYDKYGMLVDNIGFGPDGLFKYTDDELKRGGTIDKDGRFHKFDKTNNFITVNEKAYDAKTVADNIRDKKSRYAGSSYKGIGHNCQNFVTDVTKGVKSLGKSGISKIDPPLDPEVRDVIIFEESGELDKRLNSRNWETD
jgi:RHS repeat-associated protein